MFLHLFFVAESSDHAWYNNIRRFVVLLPVVLFSM